MDDLEKHEYTYVKAFLLVRRPPLLRNLSYLSIVVAYYPENAIHTSGTRLFDTMPS